MSVGENSFRKGSYCMPAFFSHYRFGLYGYKKMSGNYIKKSVKNHPHVFALGCQGPDLFFYHLGQKIIITAADFMKKIQVCF